MADVQRLVQSLTTPMLDLIEGAADPRWVGQYQTDNMLVRSLAHLVATDGIYSRLIRCNTSGYVMTDFEHQDAMYYDLARLVTIFNAVYDDQNGCLCVQLTG